MTPQLGVMYTHSTSIGYGRMGVRLAEAVGDLGIDVFDWVEGWENPVDKVLKAGLPETVLWCSVPVHIGGWYKGQHTALMSMWEATRLPEQFRENLHEFETVIVPSMQNLELFSQFHPNVHYVPLGVDPKWEYIPRRDPGLFFNVLTAGSGGRKGCELAAEAFLKAFPDPNSMDPIPRLIHKSPRGVEIDWAETVTGRISDEAELDLYADAHVYVQLSRGEGFGMQPLQAIAQGIPTILTDAHGHKAFSHLGWPVRADLEPAGYFFYGDAGDWWEPRVYEAVNHMRAIYEDYAAACEEARKFSLAAHSHFTWENTAKGTVQAIGSDNFVPYVGDRTWHETTRKKYRIRVTRPYECEVAGTKYRFMPGIDYYDMADLKRLVWERGSLDPVCEDDPGVLPDVVATTAAHHYCPTCSQRWGSGPTKADDLYEEMLAAQS